MMMLDELVVIVKIVAVVDNVDDVVILVDGIGFVRRSQIVRESFFHWI